MSGGGGGGQNTTNTIQSAEPPSWALPALQNYGGMVNNYLGYLNAEGTKGPYPGQSYAGFTPAQLAGQNKALGAADTLSGQIPGWTSNLNNIMSNPMNPFTDQVASGVVRNLGQAFNEQVLPGIRADSIGAGQYGGSRQNLAEGLAAGRFGQSLADELGTLYNNNYQQGAQRSLAAMALVPSYAGMYTQPATIYSQVGAEQQGMNQNAINQSMSNYYYDPRLAAINKAEPLFSPAYPYTTTSGATSAAYQPSDSQRAMQSAALGYGLYASGLSNPYFAAAFGLGSYFL